MTSFDFDIFMKQVSESAAYHEAISLNDNYIESMTDHSHFFTNPPETEPYRPHFLYGINSDYLKQLSRILSEKPVIFTTADQSKQIVKGRGEKAMVKNTGPFDLENLSDISIVPALTRKYLMLTDDGLPLLQTVESHHFENDLWNFISFARSVCAIIDRIVGENFDIYSFHDAFWSMVYDEFAEMKNSKNSLAMEVDLALQDNLPTDSLNSKMMKFFKMVRDNWFPSGMDLSILGVPVAFSKDHQRLLQDSLNSSTYITELSDANVQAMREFLTKNKLVQFETYRPYLLQVNEIINRSKFFNHFLKKIVEGIKFFQLPPVAKICAAHNSHIKRGREMDVILL